uniref:pullulanase X25 domain-containing protein n=1 Tax=Segatella hominis TaxID=2518605 RepID=UPI004024AD31
MRRTIFTLIMLCIATLTLQAQTAWTAAGSSTLFGSNWNETDTSNDLTDKGDGIWELTKTGCILEQNVKNELKVLKNHSWAESYPAANYVFTVKETGTYSVTIQFNANNFEINVKTTKTGDAVIGEKTWTVAGFGTILGIEWDPKATENDMIKQDDNVTYILTKTDLTLAIGTYKYKICANHGWAENYGDEKDSEGNASVFITKDGIYDLTFTFNSKTHEVSCDATRKADAIIEKIWSVAGSEGLFETAWDEQSTANEMTKQKNNIYVLVKKGISLNAQTYEYKVCANHDWTESYGENPIDNATLTIEADGIYDLTFTFNSVTKEVSATAVRTDTDGISQIAGDVKAKNVVFNLQGHRVSTPKQGVYIINGKKVVVK